MGLYLKCPGCQAQNPLYAQVCANCGQALDNLPRDQRVYVVEAGAPASRKAAPAPVKAVAPKQPAPAAPAAPPAEKKPKRSKKKKG